MNRVDIQEKMIVAGAACLDFMRTLHGTVSSHAAATASDTDAGNLGACGAHCSLLADAYFDFVEDLPESILVSKEVWNFWPQICKNPATADFSADHTAYMVRPSAIPSQLTPQELSENEANILTLILQCRFSFASNVIAVILCAYGYGSPPYNFVELHTPLTIRFWLTRFAILIKDKKYSLLYFEWKKLNRVEEICQDKHIDEGCQTPENHRPCFCFRLIIAKMPLYFKPKEDSLKRLFDLFNRCQTIHMHFKAIDEVSAEFWYKRKIRVGYAIASYAIKLQKFELLNQVTTALIGNCQSYDEATRADLFGTWATLHQELVHCMNQLLACGF